MARSHRKPKKVYRRIRFLSSSSSSSDDEERPCCFTTHQQSAFPSQSTTRKQLKIECITIEDSSDSEPLPSLSTLFGWNKPPVEITSPEDNMDIEREINTYPPSIPSPNTIIDSIVNMNIDENAIDYEMFSFNFFSTPVPSPAASPLPDPETPAAPDSPDPDISTAVPSPAASPPPDPDTSTAVPSPDPDTPAAPSPATPSHAASSSNEEEYKEWMKKCRIQNEIFEREQKRLEESFLAMVKHVMSRAAARKL